ncbi:MAG TPA: 3-hydroxyacyl-CoA dehydrogenase family protein [Flavitalea sp.]|nr:3-hydroxyacyl-CoA dehydrogenase family protein [Flavitalea sp.]
MNNKAELKTIEVGVVGLGLMGSSIVVSLLLSGHPVKAIAPVPDDMILAGSRIREQLKHCRKSGLLNAPVEQYESKLEITEDYRQLENCTLVFECVIEDLLIKGSVYNKIAKEVKADTIIASNTSAIAISILQELVPNPERFIGIHWAEPAYATRFMEITCGEKTFSDYAEWVFDIAHYWGKEPTLLRKDIRGFITNRLMYAVYREIFHLIGHGHASIEDVDKAMRYDAGSWITLMGVLRRMDFVGLADSTAIFKNIFPVLCNADNVPALMQEMVDNNARGTQNQVGLYKYTSKEAKEWEDAFAMFNKDIYQLASFYPAGRYGAGKKKVSVT